MEKHWQFVVLDLRALQKLIKSTNPFTPWENTHTIKEGKKEGSEGGRE